MFKNTAISVNSDERSPQYAASIRNFFNVNFPESDFRRSSVERPGLTVTIESVFTYKKEPTPTSSIEGDVSYFDKLKNFKKCVAEVTDQILMHHYVRHGAGAFNTPTEQRTRRIATQEVEKYCKALLHDQYTRGIEYCGIQESITFSITYTPFGLSVKWSTAHCYSPSEFIAI